MLRFMCLDTQEFADILVRDDDDPDYVIATDMCFMKYQYFRTLKRYLFSDRDHVFIFFSRECRKCNYMECNLNIFDYAAIWDRNVSYPGRIIHNVPYIYNSGENSQYGKNSLLTNTLTREEAIKILEGAEFCNFIYSHFSPERERFFHMLSRYKKIVSLGRRLNNAGTKSTREQSNWYDLSVDMKRGYKFSIAMENASSSGYTTEKLITSLQAHTVPIYWGDPEVTSFINPKAFINCNDYSSFDEVIERVKEIDNNDDLWLDMVTQPWQTEEQMQKTLACVEEYRELFRNIFTQDLDKLHKNSGKFSFSRYLFLWNIPVLFHVASRVWIKFKKLLSWISIHLTT